MKKKQAPRASKGAAGLSPRDLQRVRAILKLGEDFWSRRTIEHLSEICLGCELSKRQSMPVTRKRLHQLERAARTALAALDAMDERGLDAWLLRKDGEAFDVPAERERFRALLERVEAALDAPPGPRSNTTMMIRALGSLYTSHTRKRPTSSPGGEFEELVCIILKLQSPQKEIRAALK